MSQASLAPAAPALDGVRVLDLSRHIAGPYAAKLLAAYGADVVKVERPRSGDPLRHHGPFVHGRPGLERSLAFLDVNVGKRGVTLDVSTPTGRALLLELVADADVVVESFRPGTLAGWGLSVDELQAARPGLLVVSVTNFGQTGPYRDLRASEIVLYAMGHEMYSTGLPDREPLSLAPRLTLYYAGLSAAVAAVSGLLAQRLHGRGDHVDVSIMETFASCMDRRADSLVAYDYCGEKSVRLATMTSNVPQPYARCRDGHVVITLGGMVQWHRFADAIGQPVLHEERYQPPHDDPPVQAEVEQLWLDWCAARSKHEVAAHLQSCGIACAPVNSVADLEADENLAARGFFRTVDHPETGPAAYAGPPFVLEGGASEAATFARPAPRLGEHNAEVLGALGCGPAQLEQLATAGVV